MFIQKREGEIYTKKDFGLDLKTVLGIKKDPYDIGAIISEVYMSHRWNIELEVERVAFYFECMQDGEEFHYTIEELHQIADDLIKGQYPKILKEK
jgi:hypothetical protein